MELKTKEIETVSLLNKTDKNTEQRKEESQIYFMAQTVCTNSLTTKLYHLYKAEELPSCPTRKTSKNPQQTNPPCPPKKTKPKTNHKTLPQQNTPKPNKKKNPREKHLGINNSYQLTIVDIS